jgi:hypothetical protein
LVTGLPVASARPAKPAANSRIGYAGASAIPTSAPAAMAKAMSITRRGPKRSVAGPATSDSGPPTRKKAVVSRPSWKRLMSNSATSSEPSTPKA